MKKILSILFIISACAGHAADTSYPINDFKRQTIRQLKIYDNGDSTFSQSAGSSGASAIEWILNGGKDYLLSCRNISGNSRTIS